MPLLLPFALSQLRQSSSLLQAKSFITSLPVLALAATMPMPETPVRETITPTSSPAKSKESLKKQSPGAESPTKPTPTKPSPLKKAQSEASSPAKAAPVSPPPTPEFLAAKEQYDANQVCAGCSDHLRMPKRSNLLAV